MHADQFPEARGDAAPTPGADDPGAFNDRLAREHDINAYYARSPLPVRWIEQRRLAVIRDFVGSSDDLDLCEVGSGGGHVLAMFPRARRTAIDVSGEFLAVARKNLAGQRVTFLHGQVEKMGLPDASFDRVICTEVLEHTQDPEAIVATMARLLRPNGIAVITIPNDRLIQRLKDGLRRTPVGWLLGRRVEWGGDRYHIHQWTAGEFRTLLARHFRVTAHRGAPANVLPIRMCFRAVPL